MSGNGVLESAILDFFLKGDMSLDGASEPCPVTWLVGSGWKDLLFLGQLNEELGALLADFKANVDVWKDWYDLEAPESVPIPNGFHPRLLPMQRLCVMRCFRPDRVYNAVKLFVIEMLGKYCLQAVTHTVTHPVSITANTSYGLATYIPHSSDPEINNVSH